MRNQQIEKYFPWLSETQEQQLELLLWQRAAQGFESAGLWRNAADCWVQAGDTARASELYARSGDRRQAGLVLLECSEYAAALKLYQTWGASLLSGDVVGQVEALLGQAACHLLGAEVRAGGLSRASGLAAYHQAHELVVLGQQSVRVWLLLAQYGERVGRYDVVESSCERGLALARKETERVEVLRVYQRAAERAGDRTQMRRLAEQLAEFGAWETEAHANWHALRDEIERLGFREGVHDALHFVNEEQKEAWKRLAVMENAPEVDEYMRTLTPEDMVYIPPGAFLMGATDEEADQALAEYETSEDKSKPELEAIPILIESTRGQYWVYIPGYFIDRTPVTHGQYQKFMDVGGYTKQEYWTESGWNWRSKNNRAQPDYWEDPKYNSPDQPVGGLSWFEAIAYSRWAGKILPSEAQWEKASSWDPNLKHRRRFPWGDTWDEQRCNWNLSQTSPVARYSPAGDSAYGLVDMAGNVMEWCTTRWGLQKSRCDYPYPYRSDDNRESLGGDENMFRIKRGGCCHASANNRKRSLRCSHRTMSGSDAETTKKEAACSGFRCVVSIPT